MNDIIIDFPALSQKFENEFLCDVSRAARSRWVRFNDFAQWRIN
jgi:hypothetical protein